jgi:hypothetical protein
VNFIALIVLGVQTQTGFVVDVTYQEAAIVVINFVLRLITKTGLE